MSSSRIDLGYYIVSLHRRNVWETICDARASRVKLGKYFAQNSLSAPTQVFEECWSGVPPPSLKMEIWSGLGTLGFELVRSLPPPWKFGQHLAFGFEMVWSSPPTPKDLCGSRCVETNRCVPQGHRLVFCSKPRPGCKNGKKYGRRK